MTSNYIPLTLVKESSRSFEDIKDTLISNNIKNADKIDLSTYIKCLLDDDTGYEEAIDFLKKRFLSLMFQNSPNYLEQISRVNSTIDTEFKDVILYPILLEEWSKSKQVFKPDKDFADALLHTEKLCITTSMINHLPYNLFYIDLTDCTQFKPITGIFVHIIQYNDIMHFTLYSITENLTYFSFYLNGKVNDQGAIVFDFSLIDNVNYDTWMPNYFKTDKVQEELKDIKNSEISRKDTYAFALQLIAYLSIEEPQLTESELTKTTYKKPTEVSRVRNKWSEVRIQDVGIKYGTNFRKTISDINSHASYSSTGSTRKSPIPHFRCAHWHKFWVGTGRTQLRVKWIEPIFIGNGDSNNIVIHNVK